MVAARRKSLSSVLALVIVPLLVALLSGCAGSQKQSYDTGVAAISSGDLDAAETALQNAGSYEDAQDLLSRVQKAKECIARIKEIAESDSLDSPVTERVEANVQIVEESLPDYPKDEVRNLATYAEANYDEQADATDTLISALSKFESLGGWSDAQQRAAKVKEEIEGIFRDAHAAAAADSPDWASISATIKRARGYEAEKDFVSQVDGNLGKAINQQAALSTLNTSVWCNWHNNGNLYSLVFGADGSGMVGYMRGNLQWNPIGLFTWSLSGENQLRLDGFFTEPDSQSQVGLTGDYEIAFGVATIQDEMLLVGEPGTVDVKTLEIKGLDFVGAKNLKWARNSKETDAMVSRLEKEANNAAALN